MSDYHILEQDREKKGFRIVFHFPVPVGNNSAGKTWKNSLIEWKLISQGTLVSQVPGLDAGEQALLNTGDLNEIVQFVRFSHISLTPTEKKAEIDSQWNVLKDKSQNELAIILEYWGGAFNIP